MHYCIKDCAIWKCIYDIQLLLLMYENSDQTNINKYKVRAILISELKIQLKLIKRLFGVIPCFAILVFIGNKGFSCF